MKTKKARKSMWESNHPYYMANALVGVLRTREIVRLLREIDKRTKRHDRLLRRMLHNGN